MPIDDALGELSDEPIIIGNETKETFSIREDKQFYIINGIKINGEIKTIKWTKELLHGGIVHTQEEWVKITNMLPDAEIYHATLKALFENKEGDYAKKIKEIKEMFKKSFDNDMMTGTRVKYKLISSDEVIHNYGSQQPRIVNTNLTIPDMFVAINKKCGLEKQMEALLGTNNIKEIQEIYKWMGYEPYLGARAQKPYGRIGNKPVVLRHIKAIDHILCIECNIQTNFNLPIIGAAHGAIVEK